MSTSLNVTSVGNQYLSNTCLYSGGAGMYVGGYNVTSDNDSFYNNLAWDGSPILTVNVMAIINGQFAYNQGAQYSGIYINGEIQ